jgi:dihydrofolate reductase
MDMQKIVFVVALAQNRVIGANNALPWRLSSDLKRFRERTWGKPLIMGRRTYDSIGRPLPGRETIAISRDPEFTPANVLVAREPEAALALGAERASAMGADEIIVAGGAQIYRVFLDLADVIHLTHVDMAAEGDVHFPELDPSSWREISREAPARTEKDEADFSWITLERVRG